jgi:hypothetical protein
MHLRHALVVDDHIATLLLAAHDVDIAVQHDGVATRQGDKLGKHGWIPRQQVERNRAHLRPPSAILDSENRTRQERNVKSEEFAQSVPVEP